MSTNSMEIFSNPLFATYSVYACNASFDWSFARLTAPVVTTTSIILCFNKHWLTQVHLENGR